MFNLDKFIRQFVTKRERSMFAADIEANKPEIEKQVRDKRVCVIGGAGSIGSSFIKALLPFHPKQLIVVDLNENGLAELTRDLRSSANILVPEDYRTYHLISQIRSLSASSERSRDFILLLISLRISMSARSVTNTRCKP